MFIRLSLYALIQRQLLVELKVGKLDFILRGGQGTEDFWSPKPHVKQVMPHQNDVISRPSLIAYIQICVKKNTNAIIIRNFEGMRAYYFVLKFAMPQTYCWVVWDIRLNLW